MSAETETRLFTQSAPFPYALERHCAILKYKDGWFFDLFDNDDRGQGSVGLTLIISAKVINSYPPNDEMYVRHLFPVPPAAYDSDTWRRWLLDRIVQVETHEACEFFVMGEERPYAPNHGDGRDPYTIFEYIETGQAERRPGMG